MKTSQRSTCLSMVVGTITNVALIAPCVAQGDPSRNTALELRQNVVNIAVARGAQIDRGSGLIVGERPGTLFIVTARHVVAPDMFNEAADETTISVEYFGDRGNWHNAKLLELRHPGLDLALIEAAVPSAPIAWLREAQSTLDARSGEPVWFVSAPHEWDVPALAGAVHSWDEIGDVVMAEFSRVARGTSGGPVVSKGGIIGLAITDDGQRMEVIPLSRVKGAVRGWGKPWSLVNRVARSEGTHVSEPPEHAAEPAYVEVAELGYRFRALSCRSQAGEIRCTISIENVEEGTRRLEVSGYGPFRDRSAAYDNLGTKYWPRVSFRGDRPTHGDLRETFVPGVPVNMILHVEGVSPQASLLTLVLSVRDRGTGKRQLITLSNIPIAGRR